MANQNGLNTPSPVGQSGSQIYAADAGVSDTYAITLSPVPLAYTTGMVVNFKANTANTAAATLNVNSLGAKTIKKQHDQDLATGDIESGQLVTLIYDGTNFQMQSQLAQAPVNPYAVLQDGSPIYALDAVGTDSYAITLSPALAAYGNGVVINFKAGTANTGPATLNVNGLGAIAINKFNDQALTTGDIEANQIVTVVYNSTGPKFQMVSQNAQTDQPYSVQQDGSPIYGLDAVGTDSYAITLSPVPAGYVTGMVVNFKAGTANTGGATLNVNGLGALAILKQHDQALATGDIELGQIVTVVYDGTQFQMQSQLGQVDQPTAVLQSGSPIYGVDSVGTDAYAITLSPAPAAYADGMEIRFKAGTANTTDATLNVNGLGAVAILKLHDQVLATGDIEAGQIITVIYDTTGPVWQMQSNTAATPGGGTVTSVATAGLATGGAITTTGTVTVTASTQANMEAATSTTTAVTPAVVQYHPGIVKAWGLSNATLSALTAGYNVASVTDGGTGVITFNYTTAMSSANYAATLATYSNDGQAWGLQIGQLTTGGVLMYMRNSVTSALTDPATGLIFMASGDQ